MRAQLKNTSFHPTPGNGCPEEVGYTSPCNPAVQTAPSKKTRRPDMVQLEFRLSAVWLFPPIPLGPWNNPSSPIRTRLRSQRSKTRTRRKACRSRIDQAGLHRRKSCDGPEQGRWDRCPTKEQPCTSLLQQLGRTHAPAHMRRERIGCDWDFCPANTQCQ